MYIYVTLRQPGIIGFHMRFHGNGMIEHFSVLRVLPKHLIYCTGSSLCATYLPRNPFNSCCLSWQSMKLED